MNAARGVPPEPGPEADSEAVPAAAPDARPGPAAWLALGLIRLYQRWCRPWMPPMCRFTPSCSEYMALAIRKHGLPLGLLRGTWRICRCNPLCRGGVDFP